MAGECGTSLRQRGCYQRHLAGIRVKRDGAVGLHLVNVVMVL